MGPHRAARPGDRVNFVANNSTRFGVVLSAKGGHCIVRETGFSMRPGDERSVPFSKITAINDEVF